MTKDQYAALSLACANERIAELERENAVLRTATGVNPKLLAALTDGSNGEYNVLELLDLYHDQRLIAEGKIARIGELLGANGCDCECDHHWEEHDDDCERCLACRIADVLQPTK